MDIAVQRNRGRKSEIVPGSGFESWAGGFR